MQLATEKSLQNRTLADISGALPPKLISGEIRVVDAERALGAAE
jgi:hypothetical protein